MSNNKNTGGLFNKGYYIALALCAVAVGITGYVYYRNTQKNAAQAVANQSPEAVVSTPLPADAPQHQEDVPAVATDPQQKPAIRPSQPEATQPPVKATLKTAAPLEGESVMGYSMEALSYNQTTRDWRVHNGVDLAAKAGTPVLAAADGTVYTVFEDEYLGTTVVIRHEGGYDTRYASLNKELPVKPGDKVKLGQTIGTVGSTALVETALGPHLHFSVTFREEPMDPAEFLALS